MEDNTSVGVDSNGFAVPHPSSILGRIANRDKDAIAEGLLNEDKEIVKIAANYAARFMDETNGDNTSVIAFYKTLPEASLKLVKEAFLDVNGLYAADQAGYDVNRPNYQIMYENAWNALGL